MAGPSRCTCHASRTTWFEATRVLPGVLAAFGLEHIILVGNSDGGTIALSYLGSGLRARAVIAVAPHVRDERITHETIAIQRAEWYSAPLRARLLRDHENADTMFLSWTEI